MKKTAVLYARYSTENQRQESIVAQVRAIKTWAEKNDIDIIREYTDEGISGTSDDRPGFLRMMQELPGIKPDYVLVHKFDRFARNRYDAAIYKRQLEKIGCRLIAVDQPIEDSPEGVILESLLEGMAEYYSKNLSREVMKGMKENAYEAKFNGGWVPLGFDIDNESEYVINEKEAAIIRKIFDMKAQGFSHGQIVDELNALGYRTKRNNLFSKTGIHEILNNEKYIGVYVYNRIPKRVAGKRNNRVTKPTKEIIRIPGAIPAIIDQTTWEAVRSIMNKAKTGSRPKNNVNYILTGVLKCPECKGAMVGFTSSKSDRKGNKIKYHYYVCNNAKRKINCEHRKQYPKYKLEHQVLDDIENNLLQADFTPLVDKLWEEIQKVNTDYDGEQAQVRQQLKAVESKLQKYITAIENGVDASTISKSMNKAGQEKKELEKRLEQALSPFSKITKPIVKDYLKRHQNTKIDRNDLEECRKIITEYINSVTIIDSNLLDVVYKAQFSAYNSGVGGPTLIYTH